jgi:hypothetical protein
MTSYVLNHKRRKVISERQILKKEYAAETVVSDEALPQTSSFTDIDFDDI